MMRLMPFHPIVRIVELVSLKYHTLLSGMLRMLKLLLLIGMKLLELKLVSSYIKDGRDLVIIR